MSNSAITEARTSARIWETDPRESSHAAVKRFTIDGSNQLELRLENLCELIQAKVCALIPAAKLEALVLGGGYGRGQGGVLKTDSGDEPYNDLEFYVFLRGNRILNERQYRAALLALGEALSPEAGLHVEFKVDSLERLRRGPVSMFSYDLVSGNRVLIGSADVFDGCEHHRDAAQIPLAEATRLLFNRCTGLLLSKELLNKDKLAADDCDFIGRNLAKAQLAFGDVILTAVGQYHWSCLERHERLKPLVARRDAESLWFDEIVKHHSAGMNFKVHPQRCLKSKLALTLELQMISRLGEQLWLWLENRRLNQCFNSIHDYAFSSVQKCFDSFIWRNWLLNLRLFGPRVFFDANADRYPRERLFNALPLLLWEESLNDLKVKRFLQKQLRTRAADWQSFVAAYKAIWPSFS